MFDHVMLSLITISMYVAYNFAAFSYATKLLVGGKRNILLFTVCTTVNVLIYGALLMYDWNFLFFYPIAFAVLTVEFKLLSKALWKQVLLSASLFAMHIATINLPVAILTTAVAGVAPAEIHSNQYLNLISGFITLLLLYIVLMVVDKFIPKEGIIKLSLETTTIMFLMVVSLGTVIFVMSEGALLLIDTSYPQQVYIVLACFSMQMVMFYYTFIYCINFITMSVHKRHADEAMSNYEKLIEQKQEVLYKVERDSLTGAYNKKFILDLLAEMYEDESLSFGLLYVDINRLKYVNDNLGHDVGDMLIIEIYTSIQSTLRERDLVARVGGDELLIVLDSINESDIELVIDRINIRIALDSAKKDYPFSASVGGTYVSDGARTLSIEEALNCADNNMRLRKRQFYLEEVRPC